jgi:hypothetical protein
MKINNIFLLAVSAFTLGLTACSSSTEESASPDGSTHTLISFESSVETRSGEGTTPSSTAFTSGSVILLCATDVTWKTDGITKFIGCTAQAAATGSTVNDVTAPLYWDDFGAGDLSQSDVDESGLAVYGIAVNDGGKTDVVNNTDLNLKSSGTWTSFPCDFSGDQSTWNAEGSSKDYVISNNISGTGKLKYVKGNEPTAALTFTHPFSKITINFIEGDGYANINTDFVVNSITLKGFNTKGTLDITKGDITLNGTTPVSDITRMKLEKSEELSGATTHTYDCLVLPGRNLTTASDVLTFNIDNNIYSLGTSDFVSQINSSYQTMKAGVNYVLNITVTKTQIKTTATITDWEDVPITASPSNGSEASFYTNSNELGQSYDLFMSSTNAANAASASTTGFGTSYANRYTYNAGTYTPSTTIYWPNNNTYYHFRALSPIDRTVQTDATNGDYVALETKAYQATDNTYTDVVWGAPYTTSGTLYTALGPTKSAINLQFQHKMSKVIFVLQTTTGSDAVTLTGPNTVKLGCKATACLRLGDGTVNGQSTGNSEYSTTVLQTSNYTTESNTQASITGYTFGVVPQVVKTASPTLWAEVKVSDGNIYKITDLSTITGSPTSWEPGKIYTYTLTLKKTGLSTSNVTVTDWSIYNCNQNVQIQ